MHQCTKRIRNISSDVTPFNSCDLTEEKRGFAKLCKETTMQSTHVVKGLF